MSDPHAAGPEGGGGENEAMKRLANDPIYRMNWGPARVEEVVALVASERFAALKWSGEGCTEECAPDCPCCITGAEIARALRALPDGGGSPSEKAAEAYFRDAMAGHLGPDEDIGDWGRNQVAHIRRRLRLAYAVDFPAVPAGAGPSEARQLVNKQAEDEGLWCEPGRAVEAYLQSALRALHAAVERDTGGETGPLAGPAGAGGVDDALKTAALAVLASWDSLDAVPGDDERPTADFAAEMDSRLYKLREALHV